MKKLLLFLLLAFAFAPSTHAGAPAWPSLAEQLRADAVTPHSALEALIVAHQDFSLLRPEEARDKIPVPLWLRVIWRQAHPELTYPAADPTGGYPLVLKEVHEWMLSHQSLVPGEPDKDATPEEDDAAAAPTKSLLVAGEKRVSGVQTSSRSESDIRVNYWDPLKIVSASNNISSSGSQAQFYSTDGGATWGQSSLPRQTGDAFHSDPTVEWTSDGTAWSTTIGINSSGSVLHMRAYKSTDNGATWTFDATFSGTQTSTDKQIIWVDHSATSPFKDNLYAIWHNGNPAYINRRTGPAGSWQAPIQVSGTETGGTAIGDDVKTNAFGDLFGFWPATGNSKVFVVKSTTGGASFGTPVQVATTFDSYDIGVPAMDSRRALIYISGGAYRTATKNLVYASWTDLTGASGCNAPANEPGASLTTTCKSRIWVARSTDGGATWQAPVMINNQASLNDQFNQWMVVDETTGALGIMYYDSVGDPGRKKVDVWYQSSYDDGATWSPAVKVTSAQTDETISGSDSGNQFGDYNSLSGIAGQFFPTWTDRRSNGREEIWTAKVTDSPCTPPGAPAIGTATATAPNQIQVTWGGGAPAAATFNVYRAAGTCAAPGAFTKVGSAVAGSPYTDGAVVGGFTYAYQVTGLDAGGTCESAPSGCVQATATGTCTLAPTFAGLAGVANPATATCGLNLTWTAATAACAGPVTYNVYRSTATGFTPAPANRVATSIGGIGGIGGTGYSDISMSLASGTPYFYVVRAVDASNGVEEGNTVQRGATPTGPAGGACTPRNVLFTDSFEGGVLPGPWSGVTP
ncbi:MAG TPA: sialidase family protein [Thermoanaerobaculia bacterium]|nr:sialidase family protein [Thermoanaerobaculia bacterium]